MMNYLLYVMNNIAKLAQIKIASKGKKAMRYGDQTTRRILKEMSKNQYAYNEKIALDKPETMDNRNRLFAHQKNNQVTNTTKAETVICDLKQNKC